MSTGRILLRLSGRAVGQSLGLDPLTLRKKANESNPPQAKQLKKPIFKPQAIQQAAEQIAAGQPKTSAIAQAYEAVLELLA